MIKIEKITDKSEYQIDGIGEVQAKVLIGGKDETVGEKVIPNTNISWECFSGQEKFWMNLNRKNVTVESEKETLSDGELSIKVGDNTDIWKTVNDKLKWNIQFDKKPLTNKFEWELKSSPELLYFYQDTLENDWLRESENETKKVAGCSTLSEYLARHKRPDNVVGSYAIYCGKKNNTQNVKYFTGKLCHIYRPLCIDDNGLKEWAVLNIDKDILSITIPQAFLDNAKYPIILDPEIGYNAEAGTNGQLGDDWILATRFACSASGNANPGTIYAWCKGNAGDGAVGAYADNSGTVGGQSKLNTGDSVIVSVFNGGNPSWQSAAITWINITTGTDYWLALETDEIFVPYYDSATPGYEDTEYKDQGGVSDGVLPNPFPAIQGSLGREYALYVDYSAAAVGLSIPISLNHRKIMKNLLTR